MSVAHASWCYLDACLRLREGNVYEFSDRRPSELLGTTTSWILQELLLDSRRLVLQDAKEQTMILGWTRDGVWRKVESLDSKRVQTGYEHGYLIVPEVSHYMLPAKPRPRQVRYAQNGPLPTPVRVFSQRVSTIPAVVKSAYQREEKKQSRKSERLLIRASPVATTTSFSARDYRATDQAVRGRTVFRSDK